MPSLACSCKIDIYTCNAIRLIASVFGIPEKKVKLECPECGQVTTIRRVT